MPVQRFQTKTEFVYETLRQEILSGTHQPGDRLPLIALANRFELSTIPVREAIRMLSRDKLVDTKSHRGATVVELFDRAAYDLVEVRLWLEVRAALNALPNLDAAALKTLHGINEEMRRLAEARHGVAFSEANRKFHMTIYKPGRNPTLIRQISDLWDQVWLDRTGSIVEVDGDRMLQACDEHQEILTAIAARSATKLRSSTQHHMNATMACWERVTAAKPDTDTQPNGAVRKPVAGPPAPARIVA